ncbi:MAG TPA: ABC transporter substrate-binding protein, partial [Longimicrobiales bacterium]|nr:ABC transporter substrate-binding protein [Longimicrobiales bacterium]
MTTMRWLRGAAAAAGLVLAVGCAGDAGNDEAQDGARPRRGGTLVIGLATDLGTLNPLASADRWGQEVAGELLFLPLIRYDSTLEYMAALAESWEMLGDTGAIFHLRRDVRWHDGQPTTAEDVVFTIERAKDPRTMFPNASYLTHWTGAEALDSFTVRVSYTPHVGPLTGLPFLPIVPRHLLDTIPPERTRQASFGRAPVGNGPFRFLDFRANDRWVFGANDDFPEALGGRPQIDRVVMRIIPEQASQVAELRAGTIDLALGAPAGDFARLDSLPQLRGIARPTRQYFAIGWNNRHPPLDDPIVRRALAMALNRERMLTLRYGYGELAAGPVPSFHWAYPEDVEPLPFSPDSARALLASRGIEDRNGDGTVELRNGSQFGIQYWAPTVNAFNRDVAELVRGDLAAIGVTVNVRGVDYNTMIADVTGPRTFDAAQLGFSSDFHLNLRDSFHSDHLDGDMQLAGYANPRADSLIEALERTVDREDALPLYAEFQRLIRDEQPWTIIYYYPDLFVINERVRNVHMDIRGVFTSLKDWW